MRQAVDLAFDSLHDRLVAAGFTQEQANQFTCELLYELLTNAEQAALFVNALSAVPDTGPRLESPTRARGKHARRKRRS
jgi:hypothetical protein